VKKLISWLPWAGLALYGLCGLAFWVRPGWRPEWDSASYLLLARSLATGDGYRYLGEPFFLRPPGLSWLLSGLWQPGGYDHQLLNQLVFLAALAVLAAALVALRPRHGQAVAVAVVALVGTSPLFLRQLNWVVAELPFLALLLVSFGLFHRATRAGARFWVWSLAGALALAGAIEMRTVGLVALPSLLLLGERRGSLLGKVRGALPAALVLALSLPWMLYARGAAATAAAPSEQLLLFTYSTALWHQDPGDPASPTITPGDLLARVVDNGGKLARAVAEVFSLSTGVIAQGLVVGLMLVGLTVIWRTGPTLLDGFAVAYALLLLGYFFFEVRFVVPLLPSLYLYFLQGARSTWQWLARALGWRDSGHAAVGAIAVALVMANTIQARAALHPEEERWGAGTAGEHWEDQRLIASGIEHHTAPGARILADEAPVLALLSERTVYTYRYRRGADLLVRLPIDYVVLPQRAPPELREEVLSRCERIADLPLAGRGRLSTLWKIVRRGPLPDG